jgi:hypothetical protein
MAATIGRRDRMNSADADSQSVSQSVSQSSTCLTTAARDDVHAAKERWINNETL